MGSTIKRLLAAALVVVTVLAFAATASARLKTYGGTTFGGGRIAIDVGVDKRGKPKRVIEMRAIELPSTCELSGQLTTFTVFGGPLAVVAKRFSTTYQQPTYGNESSFTGSFVGKHNLSGVLVFNYHFLADAQFAEENCNTGELGYNATRNGPDVTVPSARPRR